MICNDTGGTPTCKMEDADAIIIIIIVPSSMIIIIVPSSMIIISIASENGFKVKKKGRWRGGDVLGPCDRTKFQPLPANLFIPLRFPSPPST
jgi:hypothetical protein